MQGGKPVSFISLLKEPVKGESGLVCLPELELSEVRLKEYDSLLLPGCMNIQEVVKENNYVKFIKYISSQENFIVASISSSPMLLAVVEVIKLKKQNI